MITKNSLVPFQHFFPHLSVLSPSQNFILISPVSSSFQRFIPISAFYPHFSFKAVNKLAPSSLCDLFQNNKINDNNLRGSSTRVYIPMPKTEFLKQSFCYDGAKIWNQIPDEIRNSASLTSFCNFFLNLRCLLVLVCIILIIDFICNILGISIV